MKCPKCPGRIREAQTKSGATYGSCVFCKGTWISREQLPKIFKTETVMDLLPSEFKFVTAFKCPTCDSPLRVGKVKGSELKVDECHGCQSIFFDRGEMDELLRLVGAASLPMAEGVKFNTAKMIPTKERCPCCLTEPLWTYQGKEDRFKNCPKCEGIRTSVEVLQDIAHTSLFGPTMFTFRAFSGEIKKCRHCRTEQSASNETCQKCGVAIGRARCFKCSSVMSEYDLHECTIERCQICNAVWLDPNELETLMTLMPDLRKSYEAGQRKIELNGAKVEAVTEAVNLAIENSRRKFLDNSPLGRQLGPLIFFFY